MMFLNTWAFGFAALGPVIVLLYLLKLKRRTAAVSTLMFWQKVLREQPRRAFFQHLRQWLSLLLHLLIFALILFALARPALHRTIKDGESIILMVDDRARMHAVGPDGVTAFSKAISRATAYASAATGLHQTAILSLAGGPTVLAPFSEDESLLRNRLSQMQCTDARGSLLSAIQFAGELLDSRAGGKRIVVFTDATPQPALVAPAGATLELIPVGVGQDNLAITAFAARALPASPETCEFFLEVANYSNRETDVTVEISRDGSLIDVRPMRLPAGGSKCETFDFTPPDSTASRNWITARLTGKDALPSDDTAYAILPMPRPLRVLLVSKGNWFLEKFLGTAPHLHYEMLEPGAFPLETATQFDAVILDDVIPTGYEMASTAGNFLFIHQTPFDTGAAAIDHPIFEEEDRTHPILRLADLERVTFANAAAMMLPTKSVDGWLCTAPLRAVEHPLIIAAERHTASGEQRLAAFAFDLTSSDLPLRSAFPLLAADTLHWLSGTPPRDRQSIRAGDSITVPVGSQIEDLPTVAPETRPASTSPKRATGAFQPLYNGFYRLSAGTEESWVAVNTFDPAESDLRHPSLAPQPLTTGSNFSWLQAASGPPLWHLLAGSALLLLLVEWWLFHRRKTE